MESHVCWVAGGPLGIIGQPDLLEGYSWFCRRALHVYCDCPECDCWCHKPKEEGTKGEA